MPIGNPSIGQMLGSYGPPLALGAGQIPRIRATYARFNNPMLGAAPTSPLAGSPIINAASSDITPSVGNQLALGPGDAPPIIPPNINPVTSGLQDYPIENPAASLGRAGSFLAKAPGANLPWNLESELGVAMPGQSAFGQILAPGSIGRGLGYGIAGQLGSYGLRKILGGERDGNVDNFAEDAMSYGGTLAGIGSMIAPGLGTAIGGGVGVGIAAIKDFLFSGDENNSAATQAAHEVAKQDKQLNTLLTQAGLSVEAAKQLRLEIMTANTGVTDKSVIAANYMSALQGIPAIAAQEQQQRGQLTGLLATQQLLAPQFDTYLKSMGADSHALAAANNSYADQLGAINPAFGGYLKQASARGVLSDSATAAAYKAQLGTQVQQAASQIGAPPSVTDQLIKQYG